MADRAAQFSPFAALTGYDSAINETARLTDRRIDLDENEIEVLDSKLQMIADHIGGDYEVTITYFVPDGKKTAALTLMSMERSRKLTITIGSLSFRMAHGFLLAIFWTSRSEMACEMVSPLLYLRG